MSTQSSGAQPDVHPSTSPALTGPPRFTYRPLESTRHIRLLRVPGSSTVPSAETSGSQPQPSQNGDFQLVHVSLDACEDIYQAVSYAWGDPVQDHFLGINGTHLLPVTKTLDVALPYLVRICTTGYLWIDQICIDQSNLTERGHQVSMMKDVFSKAAEVLIWTGEDIDGLSDAMTALSEKREEFQKYYEDGIYDATEEAAGVRIEPRLARAHWDPLEQLFSRSWFHRGWVIQEAVLAKRNILVVGRYTLPFEPIPAWVIWGSIDIFEGFETSQFIEDLRHKDITLPFMRLLDQSCRYQVSDPRDRVYAFLGLNNNGRVVVEPDYTLSVTDAFAKAARAIMEGEGNLDGFHYLPLSCSVVGLGHPSWVPHWSCEKHLNTMKHSIIYLTSGGRHWNASKLYKHHSVRIPSLGSGVLPVRGRIIDTLDPKVAGFDGPHYIPDESSLEDIVNELRKRQSSAKIVAHTSSRFSHVDARGVGHECVPKSALESPRPVFENGMPAKPDSQMHLEKDTMTVRRLRSLLSHEVTGMHDSDVWITRSGKLAMLPGHIGASFERSNGQAGDHIAVLHGSYMPVVLRKREDGMFKLVCLCYLQDAMFGEAVTWKEDEADVLLLA